LLSGVHRHPDPLGRPLQPLDRLGLTNRAVLERTEQRKHLIELHLLDPHVMQEVLRKGPQLLRRFHQPLQHGVRVHLEHPRGTTDAQTLSQAANHVHDELDGCVLAMQERAERLEKIATTDTTQQLSPGTTTGMAIGPDIAPADPAPIGTIWVGAEMPGGVHLAAAPPCGHDAGWRGTGCLWTEGADMRTGVARRLRSIYRCL